MKKLLTLLFALCAFIVAFPAVFALAADNEPSNVTITVVMPDAPAKPDATPDTVSEPAAVSFIKVYPFDVTEIRDDSGWQVIKTYELAVNELPEDILREPFERSGWMFTLTDIIRKESTKAETREHTETVTLDSDTNELEQILGMLPPTKEYRSTDGFIGILSLDVSSIKVETTGTKTTSHTLTVTREYPHLSTNDTGLLPKSVEDRGKTYTLSNVDWRAGNYVTVDYERIPEYYTAVATYTATGYSTKVTGYTTTAMYNGSLAKLSQGRTTYIAIFNGEEIRTPLEMVAQSPAPELETVLPLEPVAEPPADITAPDEPVEEPLESPAEDVPVVDADSLEHGDSTPDESGGNHNSIWLAAIPLIAVIPCMAIIACGTYCLIKRREKTTNEKTGNNTAGAGNDGGPGSTGIGG